MRTIRTLLIANRGEIAIRVATTARRMGIRTVAVYSEADRHAAFVAACDAGFCIGPAAAKESYLDMDAILRVAVEAGADAIHPGYGFLSENETFAQRVKDAGLIFVGPPASAIAAMGSKSAAKQLMSQAGVPLVPGYHGDNQDDAFLQAQADAIGYPVLLKASAGGGGKGMRVVRSSDEFAAALQSCRREARNAFADEHMLIEKYLEKSRHVEVQVFADTHGNALHLFERDCSVQRRHQKVIEEAPAPGLSSAQRKAMGDAAVAAAKAVAYVGAGTVEFIMAPDGQFYFMEMNTRLQVEHPVTEMITGLDLVALQLRIADGEPMPFAQDDLSINGHAIELRLYAENADGGFLPSMGKLHHVRWPDAQSFVVNHAIAGTAVHYTGQPQALRLDAGVRSGDEVTGFYDPMIGKLIAWAPDRARAISRLLGALDELEVAGVHTNAAFLQRLLRDDAFAQADLDTGLIVRRQTQLAPTAQCPAHIITLATVAFDRRACQQRGTGSASSGQAAWTDPWAALTDWRLAGVAQRVWRLRVRGQTHVVHWQSESDSALSGNACAIDGAPLQPVRILPDSGDTSAMCVEASGAVHRARVFWHGATLHLFANGDTWVFESLGAERTDAQANVGSGLKAPMPGKVLAVMVKAGDAVKAGQALLVMEAMKMEHTVTASRDGVVARCAFAAGDSVSEGDALLELE